LTGFFVLWEVIVILLFTDFGSGDMYVGQLKAVLSRSAPDVQLIDLLHEAPNYDAFLSAHLLAALSTDIPASSVTLAVVDAGVGGARRPIVMEVGGCWYVGPDNGLLSVIAARAKHFRAWEIIWRPQNLSHSFHGRDLFAPIAAMLATNQWWPNALVEIDHLQVIFDEADLSRVIYIDHYGNALTGLRAANVPHAAEFISGNYRLEYARVFSEAPAGAPFWYQNSIGLVEIALNCGNAAMRLGLSLGSQVQLAGELATD
jgi:S-adenosyl-L-methionine hydrolase (adenosine-forming)